MKIYADVIDHGGFRKRSRHNAIGLLLLGISLAAGGLAPCQSRAQSEPQTQSDLAALRALMIRLEAQDPRPARVSATQQDDRNGYWELQDLHVAWLGVMRRLLPTVRSTHPDLIRYWVDRTEDRPPSPFNFETKTFFWPEIEPDKDGHYKWPFSWQALKVVASTPGLSQWAGQLQTASDSLIQGVREEFWNRTDPRSDEGKAAKHRAIDLEGRRLALVKVIQGMLGAIGELDPERNIVWKPLYQFLKQDVDQRWITDSTDRAEKWRINFSLGPTYYNAHYPPAATTAHFEKLEAISQRLTGMKPQLLENALAPGQTPMAFLKEDDAREFINSQIEFDRELVRALDSPEVRANPSLIRAFHGMYDIWKSLERYEDFLRAGRWSQSFALLIEITRVVQRAKRWERREIDLDTGKSTSDFVAQRAGQTIDVLNKYKENWLEHGAPEGPLYAAIEIDEQGRRVWTHSSSWIFWKWITASDLDDLKVDGRVVERLWLRWLLPAGSPPATSFRSLQDVYAADAREIIVGLDPVGAWRGVRKVAP